MIQTLTLSMYIRIANRKFYYLVFSFGFFIPGLQPSCSIRKLVPRSQAAHPTGHGQDHEGKPRSLCPPRANQEGTSAVLVWADGALLVISELWRTLLQSNHLVRWRHQCLQSHHSQDLWRQLDNKAVSFFISNLI